MSDYDKARKFLEKQDVEYLLFLALSKASKQEIKNWASHYDTEKKWEENTQRTWR